MKRLYNIAKELNISIKKVLEYCEIIGLKNYSSNSKIDEEIAKLLFEAHEGKRKNFKEIKNNVEEINLPEEFYVENPFSNFQQNLISEIDEFTNKEKKIYEFEDKIISTIFTDFEAFTICAGIDNRHYKHIAREYFKNNLKDNYYIYEAHEIAMKTLDKYGSKLLSYIISLPPLPFKAFNAIQIFSELDKRRKKQEFPILRLLFNNQNNKSEKIQISFYSQKLDGIRAINPNVLIVKNKTTGQNIMNISRNGNVVPAKNSKNIIPVIQTFIRLSKDLKQAFIHYGLETGECSICGRELTDKESVKLGIGPICRKNL